MSCHFGQAHASRLAVRVATGGFLALHSPAWAGQVTPTETVTKALETKPGKTEVARSIHLGDETMSRASYRLSKIIVDDLELAARFYRRIIGPAKERRVDVVVGGRAMSEIIFTPEGEAGSMLILLSFTSGNRPTNGDGITVFETRDLKGFLARSTDAGGVLVQDIEVLPEIGAKVAFLSDGEGHLIEVFEWLPKTTAGSGRSAGDLESIAQIGD